VSRDNPRNDASPPQLPSVHHHPSCDECARDTEVTKENAKIEFGRQKRSQKKAERHLSTV